MACPTREGRLVLGVRDDKGRVTALVMGGAGWLQNEPEIFVWGTTAIYILQDAMGSTT